MNKADEVWRIVKNYEGLYLVSSNGNVKSLPRNGTRTATEYILKPEITKFGYARIRLSKNDKTKRFAIHRLVAEHFIPNPKKYPQINHKNAVRNDNRIENLEWVTPSQNRLHTFKIGNVTSKKLRDERVKQMRPINKYSKTGDYIASYRCITEAGEENGIHPSAIQSNLSGKSKTSGGFIWKYKK